MWEPEPGWQRLPGGLGASTVGTWVAGDRVVTRLRMPLPDDPIDFLDPHHFAYWRRPIDVALSRAVEATPGLQSPAALSVEEDAEGATLVTPLLNHEPLPGPFVARALARFAGDNLAGSLGPADPPWLARGQLAARVGRVDARGGWPTLARTTAADLADHLWTRRTTLLAEAAELPQVPQHGDPVPANLLTRGGANGDDIVAIDWGTLGRDHVGSDLGYWSLSAREDFDVLLDAYLDGLPDGLATREQVLFGARVTAVYTSLSRAEWALARVASGPGALLAKFRHPSVVPHLKALQRQADHVQALVGA